MCLPDVCVSVNEGGEEGDWTRGGICEKRGEQERDVRAWMPSAGERD